MLIFAKIIIIINISKSALDKLALLVLFWDSFMFWQKNKSANMWGY